MILCPIDQKDDSLQKVSAIVSANQASSFGTFSGPSVGVMDVGGKVGVTGGYTTLSGTSNSITDLAKSLSLPSVTNKVKGIGGCLWVLIVFPGVIIPFGIGMGLASIFTEYSGDTGPYFGVPLMVIWLIIFISIHKKMKRENQEKYDIAMDSYNKALKIWDTLYYCYKHDIVFDPVNQKSFSRSEIANYCYNINKL